MEVIDSVLPSIDTYIDALESHAEAVQAIGQALLAELLRPPEMRESWREVSLEDVVEINPESVRGWDEGKQIRYVEIGCVSPEKGIDLTEVNTFELRDAPTSAKRVIRSDDVLVSNVRPNLRKFALVPPDLDGEVATTGFTVLRAKQEALSRYIWAVIRSTGFTEHLVARVSGAAYPTIKAADVESYTFPLPPTAEQKRIVNLVDSFLESAGSYSNTLEEQAKAIPILRQALLDELLTPPPSGRMAPGNAGRRG